MRMKLFIVCSFLFSSFSIMAQDNSENVSTGAKAVYFELGGPGLASFNYDMRFGKKESGLGFRAGFGGFKIADEGALFIPVGLNYLLGKDQKNYFELGAGATFVSAGDNTGGDFSSTFGHLNFGYRYQPKNGGFFFRAAINPIFGDGFFVPYYGGIAFGYKF